MSQGQEKKNQSPSTPSDVTAESLLAAGTAVKKEPIDIDGVGRVWAYRISSLEAQQLAAEMNRDEERQIEDPYADAKWIQLCIRNASGQPVFTPEQITRIASMGQDLVLKLVRACLTVNGMNEEGRRRIEKNSATPGDSS